MILFYLTLSWTMVIASLEFEVEAPSYLWGDVCYKVYVT